MRFPKWAECAWTDDERKVQYRFTVSYQFGDTDFDCCVETIDAILDGSYSATVYVLMEARDVSPIRDWLEREIENDEALALLVQSACEQDRERREQLAKEENRSSSPAV